MKRIGLFFVMYACMHLAQAQIAKHGSFEIPSEATMVCNVSRDMLSFNDPTYPKPTLYYYEKDGILNIYVLSLKPDKSFNACEITKIITKKVTKENFKVDAVTTGNTTELTLSTTDKKIMETGTVFSFDSETKKTEYYMAYQNNYLLLDSEKAKDFVAKLTIK